eukprot:CAMPEP_0119548162 /NCGR_PEP_ID=MMETSP1352-20130426/2145_1 /TAXON_ID=265584 /ORGANISM="Stauroneis constricta, Strain CCMP1120" /LENGTH=463 /DNA_ID=CAMNT_0007593351 /DNA_START=688 /DNA_END=2079 /DNA_ORIENTATION=-
MTDVDIEERLNGLMTLLNAAGISGLGTNAVPGQQASGDKGGNGSDSTPSTQSSSSDAQILEIIKKLRQAPPDSPEILSALKSPEFRAFAILAAQQHGGNGAAAPAPAAAKKSAAPSLDEVMEDDEDNYPKIGPGYSDEYSVISELSTPTVMTKQQVAEEEFYKDVNGGPGDLPPLNIALGPGPAPPSRPAMQIGGMQGSGGKSRNHLTQVRPAATRRAIARSGGAAAQRRLNYQQAMAKLHSTDAAAAPVAKPNERSYMDSFSPTKKGNAYFQAAPPTPTQDPSEFPSLADNKKSRGVRNKVATDTKKKSSKKSSSLASQEAGSYDGSKEKKSKKKSSKSSKKDKESSNGSGWPAFDDGAGTASKKKDPFSLDEDGFFSSDAFGANAFSSSKSTGSDPFAPTSETAKPSSSSSRRDPFADSKHRKKHSSHDSNGDNNQWASEKSSSKKERRKGKSSRRASLSM